MNFFNIILITGVMSAIIALIVVIIARVFRLIRLSCIIGVICVIVCIFALKTIDFNGFSEESTRGISEWASVIMIPMFAVALATACLVESMDFGEAYRLNISVTFGISIVAGFITMFGEVLWPSYVMLIGAGIAFVVAFFFVYRDY